MLLGVYLLAQLKTAIAMSKTHRERHDELNSTFPSSVVQKWEKLVSDWNANPSAPNPYVELVISESPSLDMIHYSLGLFTRYIYDNSSY